MVRRSAAVPPARAVLASPRSVRRQVAPSAKVRFVNGTAFFGPTFDPGGTARFRLALRSVKDEVRDNVARCIAAGQPVVEGLVGYDSTVLPALENALLAGHDIIFLGERGQAKTRLMRSLVGLLDEWLPIVAGSEILDDPYHPVSRYARELVAAQGDDCPIEWVGHDQRLGWRSWPLQTLRSLTLSAKSTLSRWQRGATSPTS